MRAGQRRGGWAVTDSRQPPCVTLIIPTRHEAGNLPELVTRVSATLDALDITWSILFVDDSDDRTPEVIQELGREYPVELLHRPPGAREGGLSGAIAAGFRQAKGEVLAVLDADLQHPPEILAELLAPVLRNEADIAVGSRYCAGGDAAGLNGRFRHLASQGSRSVVYALFRRTRASTDPGSGLFAVHRDVLAGVKLRPQGFKMLVEVMVRGRWNEVRDVPYRFEVRTNGTSNATLTDGVWFLRHMARLWRDVAIGPPPGAAELATVPSAEPEAFPRPDLQPRPGRTAGTGLRILLVVSEFPPVTSGVARTVADLANGLTQNGHSVTVVSGADGHRFHVGEFRLNSLARRWVSLDEIRHFDLVNVHGPAPCISDAFLARLMVPDTGQRPRVVYTHHFNLALASMPRATATYNRMHLSLSRFADHTVVTTPSYQQFFTGKGRPTTVIPWGIRHDRFEGRQQEPYDGRRPLRVLFVGQMRVYKGVPVLIRATAGQPDLEVTLVGSGPKKREFERLARQQGASNVTFVGKVGDEALSDLLIEHDVIVLPSLNSLEAFGIVLLEGMAAGCFPVASNLPGVCDIARPTGRLVEPGDPASLRRALLELAANPDEVLAGQAASRDRAALFTVQNTVLGYERLFRTLTENPDETEGSTPAGTRPMTTTEVFH